ncbi:MAG: hypothetical protein R2865_06750 [Deinococcales bacterium]
MLEDVAVHLPNHSRVKIAKVLDILSHAPFQVLEHLAEGEYCLRVRLESGLSAFAEYALSLKDALPSKGNEPLKGLGEGC